MTPQQENELLRTLKKLERKIEAIEVLVKPYAPKRDQILDFKEAQEFLKFSRSKLRQLISKGEIPYSKKTGRLRFSKNALIQWMNQ